MSFDDWDDDEFVDDADFEDEDEYDEGEYDGQPSEYEEWQDVFGGDVEEYGTFGDYPGADDW